MKKIGIVTSEGGVSCAYSVGVILALVKHYGLTNPHVVIGSSGSTGTLAYYVARQYNSICNIWENLLSTPAFISYFRPWKIMDIDYLIDVIFKQQDALDTQEIKKSNVLLLIATTNYETGNVCYLSNRSNIDIFEALRASSAAPIVYGKTVKIDDNEFIDGAFGASLNTNIQKAKDEGAEIVIAIDNSNTSKLFALLLRIYALFKNKRLRKTIACYCETPPMTHESNVILISPRRKLPASTLDNDRKDILTTISMGYEDAVKNPSLHSMFFGQLTMK